MTEPYKVTGATVDEAMKALARHDKAIARLRIATTARQAMATELDAAIRGAYRLGVPQGHIGAIVGLTQQRISQIINEGSEFLT